MPLTPHDYQEEMINSIIDFMPLKDRHPVPVVPTGGGKSLIQAEVIKRLLTRYYGLKFVCLTHVKELVRQNYLEMLDQWPEAPAGVNSASLNKRDTDKNIIFASIQTVYNKAHEFGIVDVIFIDECHLVPSKGNGMYRTFINTCKKFNPKLKIIGLSATPFRLNEGSLIDGEETVFTDLIEKESISIKNLIDRGFLCPVFTPEVKTKIDTSDVPMSAGDFIQKHLEKACDIPEVTRKACKEIVSIGADRKSWLIFASGIKHAENIRLELSRVYGIDCAVITGKTKKREREFITEQFKQGRLRAVINVNVLTTGFNAKGVDLIAFLRPTKSLVLYIQMVGRGMRTHKLKRDCMILDFANLIKTHGPVDQAKPKEKKKGPKRDAPMKECANCDTMILASLKECPECGYVFHDLSIPNHDARASNLSILSSGHHFRKVTRIEYSRHIIKEPHCMRVDYYCGTKHPTASQFICFEHETRARDYAHVWWRKRARMTPPQTVEQAIKIARSGALREPKELLLVKDGKYKKILSEVFPPEETSKGRDNGHLNYG